MEKKIIQNSRPNDLVNNSLAINVHDKKYYEEEIELTSLEQKRMEKFMKDFTEIHGDNKHLFREKIKCIVEETDEKAHISYRLGNMILGEQIIEKKDLLKRDKGSPRSLLLFSSKRLYLKPGLLSNDTPARLTEHFSIFLSDICNKHLYSSSSLHDYLRTNKSQENITITTANNITTTLQVQEDDLSGAYKGVGGEIYEILVNRISSYSQVKKNSVSLAKKMAPLMRHNKIALCAGHNEEIEKAAKYINDYDDLVSRILAMAQAVGNFPLAILYNHIVQMTEEMPETIISFVVLLFIANILLGSTWIKGVDRMSNKWGRGKNSGTYIGGDISSSIKALKNLPYHTIETHIEDIEETIARRDQISGHMTYTIVGNTWGNFVGEKKQRIIKLLKENMRSGDQIYIDFFQIPENQQQIEQHISLYNTKELTKRIADFLRHQGYEPEINYKYNQDTKSIEILNENKVIHTSKRTTGQEILEEFGQGFSIVKNQTEGVNGGILIERKFFST